MTIMKRIKEVSQIVGVSKRTLQYYDEEGLLSVKRSKENYRLYDEAAMQQIWKILLYREMGFSLEEIRELLQKSEKGQEIMLAKQVERLQFQTQVLKETIDFIRSVKQNPEIWHPAVFTSLENADVSTYVEQIELWKERVKKNN